MNDVCRQRKLPPATISLASMLCTLCHLRPHCFACHPFYMADTTAGMACLFCYLHSSSMCACQTSKGLLVGKARASRISFIGCGKPAKTSCLCFLQLFHLLCCTNVGTGAILLHRLPCSCMWLGWRQPVNSVGCTTSPACALLQPFSILALAQYLPGWCALHLP